MAVRERVGDQGPPPELVAFCQREHRRLVGTLGLLVGDVELAQDLAQEVLLRVCREWEQVRRLDSPGGWAHRVGVNLARSAMRTRSRRQQSDRRFRRASEPELVAADLSDAASVRAAIAALPERQRTALVLRYYLDLSVEGVAETMGCPTGTVKTLTRRALMGLRMAGLEVDG